jgi:hypothetical protein
VLALAIVLVAAIGCQGPGLSLADAHMAEGPVIVERGGHYYLRYRREVSDHGLNLLSLLYTRKTGDAAYYFFSQPLEHVEWGNTIEAPLAYDGFEDFARRGRVFWLDPDGTERPIPVRPDAPCAP